MISYRVKSKGITDTDVNSKLSFQLLNVVPGKHFRSSEEWRRITQLNCHKVHGSYEQNENKIK